MDLGQGRRIILEILVIALLWVALFRLNSWLFTATSISQHINWIFLPAALRTVSVLLFGGTGATGLILGALFTSDPESNAFDAIALATLSGLCPYVSVALCSRFFKLPQDLGGLTSKQLLGFAVAGGIFSVIPHHLYFYSRHQVTYFLEGAGAMLIGDIIGALIMLYVVNFIIMLFDKTRRLPTMP